MSILHDNGKFEPKRTVYYAPREITLERDVFDKLVKQMEKAFTGGTHKNIKIEDPYLFAKKLLMNICKGRKYDGTIWKKAPGGDGETDWEILRKRLAVFNYDVDTGERISKLRRGLKTAEHFKPAELDIDGRVKYGAGISAILNKDEKKSYDRFVKRLKKDYPALNTESDALGIDILAMLFTRMERIKIEIGGDPTRLLAKDAADLAKLYKDTVESMGIAGKQRQDKMDSETAKTVADLVKRYHKRLENHPAEEKKRFLQECEMFLQAYKRNDIDEKDVKRFTNLNIAEVRELLKVNNIIKFEEDFSVIAKVA